MGACSPQDSLSPNKSLPMPRQLWGLGRLEPGKGKKSCPLLSAPTCQSQRLVSSCLITNLASEDVVLESENLAASYISTSHQLFVLGPVP